MLTFLTILAAAVYGAGLGYLSEPKGWLRALVWPFALGVALAKITEREMARND